MLISQLNTSTLDDLQDILDNKYVVKSDIYDKRTYLINPRLYWSEDHLTIRDDLGYVRIYESSNVNISSNIIFIYSDDKNIQDFYIGYSQLTDNEKYNYDRYIRSRDIYSNLCISTDFSRLNLHHSLLMMLEDFTTQLRQFDYLSDQYEVTINTDKYLIVIHGDSEYDYTLYHLEDNNGTIDESYILRAYYYNDLIYKLILYLSDKYGFDTDDTLSDTLRGNLSLSVIN